MLAKKVRSEYMKRFRDPKWETFAKCYEDSLRYRLTRRVMEHSHKPWFWEGWDGGSESSGQSTPRLSRNKVAPQPSCDGEQQPVPPGSGPDAERPLEVGEEASAAVTEAAVVDAETPAGAPTQNGGSSAEAEPPPNLGRASDDTDNGPLRSTSSEGQPVNPAPRRRHRRRTDLGHLDCSRGDKSPAARRPQRAKSQPPAGCPAAGRPDCTERRHRKTPNHSHVSEVCVQTRPPDKRSSTERRRARSADLDKLRHSQVAAVDERWTTEYMRCFSARLR
nr:centriole, cilia and spindle-associated protein-like [Nerophis lumbriciformis]XP_061840318.1 centriole, cilia and spindle-associated protein-like [Nerophis lumbriciformis]